MNRKVEESFKQILDGNESVERLLRPNAKRFFVMQSLISVFAMLIIAGCASLEVVEYYGFQSLWAVGILAVICIGVYMLFAGLYYKNKYYCITNKRIIIRYGMLGADYKALNIEELKELKLKKLWYDSLFKTKTGTIVLGGLAQKDADSVSDECGAILRIAGTSEVDEVYSNLVKQLDLNERKPEEAKSSKWKKVSKGKKNEDKLGLPEQNTDSEESDSEGETQVGDAVNGLNA